MKRWNSETLELSSVPGRKALRLCFCLAPPYSYRIVFCLLLPFSHNPVPLLHLAASPNPPRGALLSAFTLCLLSFPL